MKAIPAGKWEKNVSPRQPLCVAKWKMCKHQFEHGIHEYKHDIKAEKAHHKNVPKPTFIIRQQNK